MVPEINQEGISRLPRLGACPQINPQLLPMNSRPYLIVRYSCLKEEYHPLISLLPMNGMHHAQSQFFQGVESRSGTRARRMLPDERNGVIDLQEHAIKGLSPGCFYAAQGVQDEEIVGSLPGLFVALTKAKRWLALQHTFRFRAASRNSPTAVGTSKPWRGQARSYPTGDPLFRTGAS